MRLRPKTLLVVSSVMAVVFAVLFVGAALTLNRQYAQFEARAARNDALRARTALTQEVSDLERISLDWAPDDETYAFMAGQDASFTAGRLSDEGVKRLDSNVVMLMDKSWRPVWADFIDLDLQTRSAPDTQALDAILSATWLERPGDPHGVVSGTMPVGDRMMFVVARPITSTDFYAPPNGTLVLGRFADATLMDRMSSVAKMPLALYAAESTAAPADARKALRTLYPEKPVGAAPLNRGSLAVYSLVTGTDGSPVAVLRGTTTRDIYRQGQNAVLYLGISLFLLGVIATGTVYVLVDRGVLNRLAVLTRQVDEVAASGDSTARVVATGDDEIGELAHDINEMLRAIEHSEARVRVARDELEERVIARTEQLRASELRYRLLVDRMADAVFAVDLHGTITLVNDQAEDLVGKRASELVGTSLLDLMPASSSGEVARHLGPEIDPDATWTVEVQFGSVEGDTVPVELRGAAIRNERSEVVGTQWIARDIAERRRFEQQLVHMASHDHLTGMYNRRFFESTLELELAEVRRSGGRGAVLWLDIDDFKAVNDSLGHRVGDGVLVSLAGHIRKQVRESNVLARLGGDEFAVLVPGADEAEAVAVADRLLSAIGAYVMSVEGHSVRLSTSIGVVLYPAHGVTAEELLANADVAMYYAKESGRGRVDVYSPDQLWREEMHSRVAWNERIRAALEGDALLAYAQPVLDLHSNRIARYELLVRMQGEDGHVIMPSEFLPTAERIGLIGDIDRWMMHRAFDILGSTDRADLELEVNLSGKAFGDPGLLTEIAFRLTESGIEPSRLGFEITETAAISDVARAQEFVGTLKDLGCRFSLDDFGSGFSSFYYLKHLPIDCLKVDGSFIRGLNHSEQDKHLVRGIVEMCRGLEIKVVAEYVEDLETLALVRELGIDFAQGYFIGKPQRVESALATAWSGGQTTS